MRVEAFGRGVGMKECGGEPGSIESTEARIDQSLFPDLGLIRERGFTEQDATEEEDSRLSKLDPDCEEIFPDFDSFEEWNRMRIAWMDVLESVIQDASLTDLRTDMATCLTDKTRISVDAASPTDFLRDVNDAVAEGASEAEIANFAVAYADCGEGYFGALGALLLERRPEMIERHREILQRYASEISQEGYVP